jgi:uncharacterized protein (DUF2267 family)
MSEIAIVRQSVEKAHIWLKELAEELGTDDRQAAYRVLRASLHALRDRLPVNEAAQLAAQLPTLIRGIYYEDWVPGSETEASYAMAAVMRVIRRHVSAGEVEDVQAVLPAELRAVLG